MALTITKEQYEDLEERFAKVYNRATEAQKAIRILKASHDGPVSVDGVGLTQAQLDAREQMLKDDWDDSQATLIPEIDSVLGE